MERLHCPDNIKVHFAGLEESRYCEWARAFGVNYGLFSAFDYVYKKLFGKNKDITKQDLNHIHNIGKIKHVIQDSGLFSLLFGNKQHLASKETVYKWYDGLVEFTKEHALPFTCVEIDCQDICGTEIAWDLRMKIRSDLPQNRIINVFHIPDGRYGLDRLIEYSDYIAIGAPELRKAGLYQYIPAIVNYIKNKKEEIDIHLLGCTDNTMLKSCSFCSSADSITWLSALRFGYLDKYHIKDIDSKKVQKLIGECLYNQLAQKTTDYRINGSCVSLEYHKRQYQIYAGNQDYTINFN